MCAMTMGAADEHPPRGAAGYDLLKKKSDALTLRFRMILKDIKTVRGARVWVTGACVRDLVWSGRARVGEAGGGRGDARGDALARAGGVRSWRR